MILRRVSFWNGVATASSSAASLMKAVFANDVEGGTRSDVEARGAGARDRGKLRCSAELREPKRSNSVAASSAGAEGGRVVGHLFASEFIDMLILKLCGRISLISLKCGL